MGNIITQPIRGPSEAKQDLRTEKGGLVRIMTRAETRGKEKAKKGALILHAGGKNGVEFLSKEGGILSAVHPRCPKGSREKKSARVQERMK